MIGRIASRKNLLRLLFSGALALTIGSSPLTAKEHTASPTSAPASPEVAPHPAGALLVPDKFVRRWDPVTIFFAGDTGPVGGGPENDAQRYVTMTPAQPGAFTWLNPRALQFRPAEPWPALGLTTWKIADKSVVLATLLPPATASIPADGATALTRIDSISLTFDQPVDPVALAGMLDIAMTPLPGLDKTQTRHLSQADFTIKTMERAARLDNATYVINLARPVPSGTQVAVGLSLSAQPGLDVTTQKIVFSTAETFRPVSLGCADKRVPISPDGMTYTAEDVLACKTESEAAPTVYHHHRHQAVQAEMPANDDAASAESGNDGDAASGGDNEQADNDDADAGNTTTSDGKAVIDGGARDGPLAITSSDNPAKGQAAPPSSTSPSLIAKRELVVQFSTPLAEMDTVAARNLIRISPAITGVKTHIVGDQLYINGRFAADTLYRITLAPTPVKDTLGRELLIHAASTTYVSWPSEKPFLALTYGSGTVERYGPKMVPLRGRGFAETDVRIHSIDPLDRSYWPFPEKPVEISDDDRPPSPGEEVAAYTGTTQIDADSLGKQIARLGSPALSDLFKLPLTPLGPSARFGLDLGASLDRIAGKEKPGTYLVGVRALDKGNTRQWMRVQVTDLSLTTIEQDDAARFIVTSLSSGKPVAGAKVTVEGSNRPHNGEQPKDWSMFFSGNTDADGGVVWKGEPVNTTHYDLLRVSVRNGDDTLVIDPEHPPDRYTAGNWFPGNGSWLRWMIAGVKDRRPPPKLLCHVFTERPIYRPTDPVEIKAYVRKLESGALSPGGQSLKSEIVVAGPDNAEWRYPVTIADNGSVNYHFDETTVATGIYQARIELNGSRCGASAVFKKDAYRLPKFQVRLDAPKSIPLDKPVKVGMTATYYAGGAASDRPVRWRVTGFPYDFKPQARDGFTYATDVRFAAPVPADSGAVIERQDKTDGEGRASLDLDPTHEKTDQPRRYVVEATVTGDDDKTVTNTEEVLALPAFVLGMKVPRYIEHADHIPVEMLLVDANGKPLADKDMTLRVLQRQWSSILEASDFSEGKPKYRTEIVDEKRLEKVIKSGSDVVKFDVPIAASGVYIVELESSDELGRRQMVSIDLFAGGGEPVTWSRPPSEVFKVTADKASYAPGEIAKLVLQSPFQTARALAIVEQPDGTNAYHWLDVKNGYGEFTLPIDKTYLPRIPVHFALMRGRLAGDAAPKGIDLKRPETLAATAWVGVKPVKNIVTVKIDAPEKAQPGDTVEVAVHLTDDDNKPVSGEVTLWLIDQAVLALAKEAPLDPLPAFIRDRGTRTAFADTRNSIFGSLPLDEDPGGDVGEGDQALLNKVSIRKNFNPMPYYNPALMVDASGTAKVTIKMPDNLTVYKIRAKAVTGPDRFGFGTGQVAVRLPVIVEPNLPRFVRPGDVFALSAIGRVVEGEGGPGKAEVKVDGLNLIAKETAGTTLTRDVTWKLNRPERFDFGVVVPTPEYGTDGQPVRKSVSVTLGVERNTDKARDAFQVELPIQPDRRAVHDRQLVTLTDAKTISLAGFDQPVRPGTAQRSLLISNEPGLVRLMAGLTYLREYPYGCSEQRVSLARAEIAGRQFQAALLSDEKPDRAAFTVKQTLEWITSVTDENGLVAFWPGSKGDVALTAWTVQMMVEAKKAGFPVDDGQMAMLTRALKQALRSDYTHLLSGAAYDERAWALVALAEAGQLDTGYASELLRKKDYLSLEGIAQVRQAMATNPNADPAALTALDDALWKGIVLKQRNGQPVYGGLQDESSEARGNPIIFPSETRTISEMLRAVSLDAAPDPRRAVLADALVTLGKGDGWGDTNANAEAMLALQQYVAGTGTAPDQAVDVTLPGGKQSVALSGAAKLQRVTAKDAGGVTIASLAASAEHPVIVQSELTYLPQEDGSHVAAVAKGFVVTRQVDRIDPTGAPSKKQLLDKPAQDIALTVGEVVEDSAEIVNPEERHHVAIVIPLASGMEPLNPELATAPPEATPSAPPTLKPTFVSILDDQIAYFYETLPKGTYSFHFREKANIAGKFIQPAAYGEMMYNQSVNGNGNGATVTINPAP